MNLNLFKILSNYIIWNRLSQKTISRYCPFKLYIKKSLRLLPNTLSAIAFPFLSLLSVAKASHFRRQQMLS
jgi:hypothetical protein